HDAANSAGDQLQHEHAAPAFYYTYGAGSLLQNCFYSFRHQWFFQFYVSKMRMSTVKFSNKAGLTELPPGLKSWIINGMSIACRTRSKCFKRAPSSSENILGTAQHTAEAPSFCASRTERAACRVDG